MCFCAVRSSSVSVFAVRSGVSVFVLSARRPGAQPRVKEVWSAAGHFYTATSLYCHHHHHHSVIHVYLLFQASATSRLFQFLAICWIILVRFPNPLAFGSQTGTLSRFYPFNWSKLNGSLYIDESGAQVKMCRLYGRTSIKIDGKNSDAARISNLCAGSSIAAAHSVEVKLRIDSLTVAAKRQPHNVQ